jgi:hypothetical protein
MKYIQNNQKSIGKSISAYGFKNLKKKIHVNQKSRNMSNVCDFQKENDTLGYEFKSL